MNPIDGLTYWFDPTTLAWKAVGRPDIPTQPGPSESGFGSSAYGERPYGD